MNELTDGLVGRIKETLAAHPDLSDLRFDDAYSPRPKPAPFKTVLVTLSWNGIECVPGAMGGYLGEREGSALFGRKALCRVGVRIHAPESSGGKSCAAVFSRLCDVLCFDRGGLPLLEAVTCGKTVYDGSASAFALEGEFVFRGYLAQSEETAAFEKIVVKGGPKP